MAYQDEVLADSPALYLPCQETTGTALTDQSGNGLTATLIGGAVPADTTDPAAPAALGNHVYLDGVDDCIQLDPSAWFTPATNGFTLEGWFCARSSWTAYAAMFHFGHGVADVYDLTAMIYSTRTEWDLYVNNDATTNHVCIYTNNAPIPAADTWVHMALAVDVPNATGYWYANGQVIGSDTTLSWLPDNHTRDVNYVGRSPYAGDPFLSASVTHLAVYNQPLSATRVQAHYDAAVGGGGGGSTPTDTTNRANGLALTGSGQDRSVYPVAGVPAGLTVEPVRVMAQTTPDPTLKNGRPV